MTMTTIDYPARMDRAADMFRHGATPAEAMAETGLSTSTLYRLRTKVRAQLKVREVTAPATKTGPRGSYKARMKDHLESPEGSAKVGAFLDKLTAAPAPVTLGLPAIGTGPLTMSTREIATLTGKRHDNVLRDTKRMLEDLEFDFAGFEGNSYVAENGKENPEFLLPKDLSICLVSGYDVKLRLAIIRRWDELETARFAHLEIDRRGPVLAEDFGPRIASMERALLDLTKMLGDWVNKAPAQVALPAPANGPKLVSAARYITKTFGIGDPPRWMTAQLGMAAGGVARQHDPDAPWLAHNLVAGVYHRTGEMWALAGQNMGLEALATAYVRKMERDAAAAARKLNS